MGISLMSIIEIIVYCAVRIVYKFTIRKKQRIMAQEQDDIQQNNANVVPRVDWNENSEKKERKLKPETP